MGEHYDVQAQQVTTLPGTEVARALHRVVRAIHDGHCPNPDCGHIGPSDQFYTKPIVLWEGGAFSPKSEGFHRCPKCGFTITDSEAEAALAEFRPAMQVNFNLFKKWREERGEEVMVTPSVRVLMEDAAVIDSQEKMIEHFGQPRVLTPVDAGFIHLPGLVRIPDRFSQVASVDQGEA